MDNILMICREPGEFFGETETTGGGDTELFPPPHGQMFFPFVRITSEYHAALSFGMRCCVL